MAFIVSWHVKAIMALHLLLLLGIATIMPAQPMFHFSALAQQADDYLTYVNSDYKITIDYPHDWYKEEYLGSNYVVEFYSPYESEADDYAEYVSIFVEAVQKGTALDDYVDSYIDELNDIYPELDLIQETSSGVDGRPAIQIVTTDTDFDEDGNNDHKTLRVFTLASGRAYVIIYDAVQGRYEDYIGNVEQMIDSVKIDSNLLGEAATGAEFLTYHNSTYGILIEYPDNWFVAPAIDDSSIVTFYSPYENDVDPLGEYMYLGYEIVPQGTSLAEYSDAVTKIFRDNEGDEFDTVESRQTTVAGLAAHKLTYTSYWVGFGEIKVTAIWTINEDRAYLFYFAALKSTYDEYIPVAEEMFDSVELTEPAAGPTSGAVPPSGPSLITKEYLRYNNSAYAFSMEYPDNWLKVEPSVGEGTAASSPNVVIFGSPLRDAIIVVSVYDIPKIGMTLDEYTDYTLESYKGDVSLFNLEESDANSATISGHTAHKVVYTGLITLLEDSLVSVKVTQVWCVIGPRAYVVTYAAVPERFDDYASISEKAVSSFTFDESALPKLVTGEYTNEDLGLELGLSDKWQALEEKRDLPLESMKTLITILPIISTNATSTGEGTNSSSKRPLQSFIVIGSVSNDDILSGRLDEAEQNLNSSAYDCTRDHSIEINTINDMKTLKAFSMCTVSSLLAQDTKIAYDTLTYMFVTSEKSFFIILYSYDSDPSHVTEQIDAAAFEEFDELLATLKIDDTLDLSDPSVYAILEEDAHTQKVSMQTVSVGGESYDLPVISNSTIANIGLDEEKRQISFTVDGKNGTRGTTSIEVSEVLIGPFVVKVDGIQIPEDDLYLIEDKTSNGMILSISYPHSIHEITISGATVVPEFGSIAVLAMAVGLVAAIVTIQVLGSRIKLA